MGAKERATPTGQNDWVATEQFANMTRSTPREGMADRLTLFGRPRLQYASGDLVDLRSGMPTALLAYLACNNDWHSRESLAALLRPDSDSTSAKAYVRRLLHRTKEVLPHLSGLEVSAEMVRWVGSSDVHDFEDAVAAGEWSLAASLQHAPLLSGLPTPSLETLDDVLSDCRRRLGHRLLVALTALIEEGQGSTKRIQWMQRMFDLDPLNENTARLIIRNASSPSERAVAASCFERMKRKLALEMGSTPEALTLRLLSEMNVRIDSMPARATSENSPPLRRDADVACGTGDNLALGS